ncbi:hypothetical protein G3M48_006840 [Beauveria asiatica]|uniref:Uncharacterized protein n=1 Tax=Beauveria asiatica TaxID=1069075 RepID=A0AAW0RNU5_9HYPO
MSSRRRQIPVEDSWRMVDGENDSIETTLLPGATPEYDGDILSPLSSEQPSSGFPSQQQQQQQPSSQSQPNSSFGSQDSIRDFAKHQADDNVILREPFRPSIPPSVVSSTSHNSLSAHTHRTPDPEFRMPSVDFNSSRKSSGQSSRTLRQAMMSSSPRDSESTAVRRRGYTSQSSPVKRRSTRQRADHDEYGTHHREQNSDEPSIPSISSGIARWAVAVIGLAFQYAKRPLAFLLAVYLFCGAIIMTQNMLQRSIYVSLSPVCRLPGASLLNLPFCADTTGRDAPDMLTNPVEFDDLMSVQAKFENVLEKSVDGASLPLEMKRSEASLRDLRTLVKHSDIQARDELLFELDGFVDTARQSAADLQRFNTHVGSAVDAVITINRWTARYIDSLAPLSDNNGASSSTSLSLITWSGWLFTPFQPAEQVFSERILRDKYIEHMTLVSERIAALILEAQAVLRLLTKAEDHLSLIYDVSSRSAATLSSHRDEILWNVWTLVGGNARRLSHLTRQLALLKKVDAQRDSAVVQVSALVLELEAIQAGLGDLRDRVAEPGVLRDAASPAVASLPLTIHIETIDRGVERLEAARRRIRAAEDDRVREALARSGLRDDQDRSIGDSPRA